MLVVTKNNISFEGTKIDKMFQVDFISGKVVYSATRDEFYYCFDNVLLFDSAGVEIEDWVLESYQLYLVLEPIDPIMH